MNFNGDDQNSFAQNSYLSSIIFRVLLAWRSNNNDSYKKLQKNDLQILVKLSQLLAEIIICFCRVFALQKPLNKGWLLT